MLQSEFFSVSEKAQKVPGIFPAGYDKDIPDAGIHQYFYGIINHRLVIDRQQVFIGNFCKIASLYFNN